MNRYRIAAVAALVLAGCGSGQQAVTPVNTGAAQQFVASGGHSGHLVLMGATERLKTCPSKYVYCVKLAAFKPAQLYFCYSTVSYCGPSQFQYYWYDVFYTANGRTIVGYFDGGFNPNPGDPTYDTISLVEHVKSTHGKIKYYQAICENTGSLPGCNGNYEWYVGIAVK